jgi:hypothetical protein
VKEKMERNSIYKVISTGLSILLVGSLLTSCGESADSSSQASEDVAAADATPAPTQPAVTDAEFKAALAKMKVIEDKVKGNKWYEDKTSYNYYWRNEFYVYTSAGSNPTLFFNIRYFDEDWLFIESYFFNVDGETFSFTPEYGEIQRDSDTNVTEWYNEVASQENIELVQKIMNSKKTVMRLEGSKYYKDVTITQAQKSAIKNVLTVYQGLGGKL